jgi:ASPIC and UnbV
VREIEAGGGFLSFDAPIAYFGLGDFQQVERVEVQWSTGERSEIPGAFSAGSRYVIHRQARAPRTP